MPHLWGGINAILDEHGLCAHETCDDEITIASIVDSRSDAVGICLDTLGVTIFPDLVVLPISDTSLTPHQVYLAYLVGPYKTPAVHKFINCTVSFKWEDPRDSGRDK